MCLSSVDLHSYAGVSQCRHSVGRVNIYGIQAAKEDKKRWCLKEMRTRSSCFVSRVKVSLLLRQIWLNFQLWSLLEMARSLSKVFCWLLSLLICLKTLQNVFVKLPKYSLFLPHLPLKGASVGFTKLLDSYQEAKPSIHHIKSINNYNISDHRNFG